MLGNSSAVLADDDAIRIGVNFDRPPDRARRYRVFVVIEAHQAGLGDRRRHRMEAAMDRISLSSGAPSFRSTLDSRARFRHGPHGRPMSSLVPEAPIWGDGATRNALSTTITSALS